MTFLPAWACIYLVFLCTFADKRIEMKLTRIIISLVAALLAVACGSRDSFKVSGEIKKQTAHAHP